MTYAAWFIFLSAAILEVGGDACIRQGLRHQGWAAIVIGFVILGFYGLVVNLVRWDFSKLLGVYVSVFCLVSVFVGWIGFKETIPLSTWLGAVIIIVGGLIIQFGPR
jgi:small multidrug resistance family-3 protein